MVTLLGGLVALAGYTVIWSGGLMIRGYSGPARPGGPGILDLVLPTRVGKVQGILAAGAPSAASQTSTNGASYAQPGAPNVVGPVIPDTQSNATRGGSSTPGANPFPAPVGTGRGTLS